MRKVYKIMLCALMIFANLLIVNKPNEIKALSGYGGYDKGYSDWADTETGNPGEVRRTVWRYADAQFTNGCSKHDTNYETYDVDVYYNNEKYTNTQTLYKACKWDPYNCKRNVCDREGWVGGDPILQKDCYHDHSDDPVRWDCTRAGLECPSGSYGCLRWSEWECLESHTEWNGPCGNINDGHEVFTGWGAWSEWSTTEYYDSNSRKVEWKYQYSYPYPPVLGLKTNFYFVGQTISALELKQNALATDIIDGLITLKVLVTKIEYADGNIVNNPEELDTTKAQTFKLTCQVSNSRGLTTIATKEYSIFDLNGDYDPEVVNPEEYTNVNIYDRFVSTEYLDTIHTKSIWEIDEGYKVALRSALAKDEGVKSSLN